jgi:hypothetical protein
MTLLLEPINLNIRKSFLSVSPPNWHPCISSKETLIKDEINVVPQKDKLTQSIQEDKMISP